LTQYFVDRPALKMRKRTSVRAIATELNERGILTPRGGAWHPTSAARLLSRLKAHENAVMRTGPLPPVCRKFDGGTTGSTNVRFWG
jgi:hypothetical protein